MIEDVLSHIKIDDKKRLVVDEELNAFLFDVIKNKSRVAHSISVAQLSFDIALLNNLDNPEHYLVAGLLHDLAKGLDTNTLKTYMMRYFNEYLDLPSYTYHQFISVYLTQKYFNIHNEDLLDAIKFHCTGKPNMNSIGKIVYSADKADPLRGYDSSKMINLLKNDYNEGFVYTLNENRIFLLNKLYKGESTNNRLSEECFAYYLK